MKIPSFSSGILYFAILVHQEDRLSWTHLLKNENDFLYHEPLEPHHFQQMIDC